MPLNAPRRSSNRRLGRMVLLAGLGPVLSGCVPDASSSPGEDDDAFLDRLVGIHSLVGGDGRSLYGRPHGPQWLPDGRSILVEGRGSFWEIPVMGGEPTRLEVRGSLPLPSPDGARIAFVSGGEIRLLDRASGEVSRLTRFGASVSSMAWSPDGASIAFAGSLFGSQDLFLAAVPSGEWRQLTSDARLDGFPAWSPDGGTIYFQRMDEWWVDHEVLALPLGGGDPRRVTLDRDFFDYTYGSRFGQPQVSPDGAQILFPSFRSGWINQWVVPADGGEPRAVAPEDADQDHAVFSPDGNWIAFTSNREGTVGLHVVNVRSGDRRVLFDPGLGYAHSPRWSPDGNSVAFVLGTPTMPQELHVVALDGGEPTRLTYSSPDREIEGELAVPQKIRYPSADGLSIHAYLYRPQGLATGERAPAIIRLHGGPTAQYYDHFERNVQYYVRRGFVVLLPNVRGSSGFGWDFEHANDGCWARCDLSDVVAGAEYLRTLPFVDPDRIGVYGRSYGAFLTMAAVAFAPDVFQAAIPRAGYSDRLRYMEETGASGIRLLRYEMGPFEENRSAYRDMSPIFHLRNATTPTFVIEGAVRPSLFGEDMEPRTDTNIAFAREMARLGKVVEYRAYQRAQDGAVAYPAEKPRMLRDKAAFFDRHLRAQPARSTMRTRP